MARKYVELFNAHIKEEINKSYILIFLSIIKFCSVNLSTTTHINNTKI